MSCSHGGHPRPCRSDMKVETVWILDGAPVVTEAAAPRRMAWNLRLPSRPLCRRERESQSEQQTRSGLGNDGDESLGISRRIRPPPHNGVAIGRDTAGFLELPSGEVDPQRSQENLERLHAIVCIPDEGLAAGV